MVDLTLLREQAEELTNCGNSKEIAEGNGMLRVIDEVHSCNMEMASDIAHTKLIDSLILEKNITRDDAEDYAVEEDENEESRYTEECQDIFNELYDIEMSRLEK